MCALLDFLHFSHFSKLGKLSVKSCLSCGLQEAKHGVKRLIIFILRKEGEGFKLTNAKVGMFVSPHNSYHKP
jgi:hypothetical protein